MIPFFRSFMKSNLIPYVVLFLGLVFTLWIYLSMEETKREKEALRFDTLSKQALLLIENRMNAYRQTLYAGAGHYNASQEVSREEWKRFAQTLKIDTIFPGIQGIGFTQAIRPAEVKAHIDRIRAEGFEEYTIRPQGERELYTSIIYLEPFDERNRRAFGYDMYSDPTRHEAMKRAALSGESAISGKVRLVQENTIDEQHGFLIYVPVYRKGGDLSTPQSRMESLAGFVYAPFRMDDLMYGVLGSRYKDIELSIYDGETLSEENLLFGDHSLQQDDASLDSVITLSMDGRDWTLHLTPKESFYEETTSYDSLLVALLSLVLSVSLFWIILTILRTRERAQALADTMTKQYKISEERLKFALEGSGDGVWDWNVAEGDVFFSKRWKEMLGFAEDEITASLAEWEKRIHPEDKERVLKDVSAYLSGETPTYINEHRVECKDGTYKWILDRGIVVERDAEGNAVRMVGSHADIHTRKEFEHALQQSESKFRAIFEQSRDGLVVIDLMTRIFVEFNETAHEQLGYSADEFSALRIDDIEALQSPDEIAKRAAHVQKEGWALFETLHRCKSGELRDVSVTVQLLDSLDRPMLLATFQDITERKKSEKLILEAKEAAEEANIAKSQFLANMSHEIRTPMNALIGLSQMVLETRLDPKQRDILEKIYGSSRMLLGIINDILDYSKIEANCLVLESKSFALESVLTQLSTFFTHSAMKQGTELYFHLNEGVPDVVMGDELRLDQVLTNLLSNAIKFTHVGSVTLSIALAERRGDRASIRFSVSDTGIGMSEEEIQKLFRPFVQADASTTRKYGGSGLGLVITRKLVEAMGGELSLQSVKGEGSTFEFTIDTPVVSWKTPPEPLDVFPKKVLIVDDQEISRTILKELCEGFGCSVDTARNGAEAIGMIRHADTQNQGYDVVIMDWRMPVMDGKSAIQTIHQMVKKKELALSIPTVLMTSAYSKEEIDLEGVEMEGFLTKPITKSALYEAMMKLNRCPLRINESQPPEKEKELQGIVVLVVEDNELNQEVATLMLNAAGVDVDIANNGQEGVERYTAAPDRYDLILMDLQMPVLSGYDATRIIREFDMTIPIVALSAAAMIEDREKVLEAGMNDHLAKPINKEDLYRVIKKWCAPAPKRD
jgi:PAS domain S-box-containing protein